MFHTKIDDLLDFHEAEVGGFFPGVLAVVVSLPFDQKLNLVAVPVLVSSHFKYLFDYEFVIISIGNLYWVYSFIMSE